MKQLYRVFVTIYTGMARKKNENKYAFETTPFEITNETTQNYVLFGGKKRVKKENILKVENIVNANSHVSYKVWCHEEDIEKAKDMLQNRVTENIKQKYEEIQALMKVLEQNVPTHLQFETELKHDEIIFTLQEGE